jgi:hypothetical protein
MKYFENLYDCQHVKVHKTDSVWVSWLPSNAGEYYRGCARHAINFTRLEVDVDVALSSSTLRTATIKLDSVRDFSALYQMNTASAHSVSCLSVSSVRFQRYRLYALARLRYRYFFCLLELFNFLYPPLYPTKYSYQTKDPIFWKSWTSGPQR